MIRLNDTYLNRYYGVRDNIIYNIYNNDSNHTDDLKSAEDLENYFEKITVEASYSEDGETKDVNLKFYLDSLIEDGDKISDNTIKPNPNCEHREKGNTFTDIYIAELKKYVAEMLSKGQTLQRIKNSLPFYAISKKDDKFTYNGVIYKVKTINGKVNALFDVDSNAKNGVQELAKSKAEETAKTFIEKCGYKLKDSETIEVKIGEIE